MRLDLDDYDLIYLSVNQARALIDQLTSIDADSATLDELTTKLDEAQGDVFIGNATSRFVIIEIRP